LAGRIHITSSVPPLILLDGDEPAAAILAGAQIPLFFLVADPARDIKKYLEAISLATVGTKFFRHLAPPFESPVFYRRPARRHPGDEGP